MMPKVNGAKVFIHSLQEEAKIKVIKTVDKSSDLTPDNKTIHYLILPTRKRSLLYHILPVFNIAQTKR